MEPLHEHLQNLMSHGVLATVALAWLGGVITSFTPCVYPMLPITIGVIGANSGGSRMRGLFLSLVYVAGLALVYGGLGIFAAATGRFFGEVSTNPWGYFAVGNLCLLFGAWMMGWIHLPQFGANVHVSTEGKTGFGRLAAIFAIGGLSGLVAAPCTAPVLATLLTYVATTGDIVFGGLLLFVFAYGLGTLLILAGTFAGLLSSLPKSGKWMSVSKIVLALVMFAAGEYFLVQMGTLLL